MGLRAEGQRWLLGRAVSIFSQARGRMKWMKEACDRNPGLGADSFSLSATARSPRCAPGPRVACAATWLSPASCLEPRQVRPPASLKSRSGCNFCWLQSSAEQNGKCSPFSLCASGRKTERRFCLGCSQSYLLGIAHGPGMWLFGAQARVIAIFPLKTRGK